MDGDAVDRGEGRLGCTPEALRLWVRQAERNQGERAGLSSDEWARLKALEREVQESRQANEILCKTEARLRTPLLRWSSP
jgi:transposase